MSEMLFTKRDLMRITVPLIIQQVLAVTIGMIDTMMVSSAGEAAVSGVSLCTTLDILHPYNPRFLLQSDTIRLLWHYLAILTR